MHHHSAGISDEARAFAEEISRANKLSLTTRYQP
jgi:hypothetical protein